MSVPTLIYCASGNRRFAEIAIRYGLSYGAQLPATVYYPPMFVDNDWQKPNRAAYMEALREHRPEIATVLDIERVEQFEEALSWAQQASQYVKRAIIVIPKIGGIVDRIPERVNGVAVWLGYPVPLKKSDSKFAGKPLPVWEYGRRPVHLLGGSPQRQMDLARYLNAASADNNYIMSRANQNQFFAHGTARNAVNRHFPRLGESVFGDIKHDAPYAAFELSVINLIAGWHGTRAMIRWGVEDDINAIKHLANQNSSELGYVMYPALRQSMAQRELWVAELNGEIVAFCRWHKRRDGVITVYEIAVNRQHRGEKIARGMLAALPAKIIRLKCTTDNLANEFYRRVGFDLISTESGRKRRLNVWQRQK